MSEQIIFPVCSTVSIAVSTICEREASLQVGEKLTVAKSGPPCKLECESILIIFLGNMENYFQNIEFKFAWRGQKLIFKKIFLSLFWRQDPKIFDISRRLQFLKDPSSQLPPIQPARYCRNICLAVTRQEAQYWATK